VRLRAEVDSSADEAAEVSAFLPAEAIDNIEYCQPSDDSTRRVPKPAFNGIIRAEVDKPRLRMLREHPDQRPVPHATMCAFSTNALWRAKKCRGLALCRDLCGERLRNDLSVSYNERIGRGFINVVCGLGAPENIRVVTVDALLMHGE